MQLPIGKYLTNPRLRNLTNLEDDDEGELAREHLPPRVRVLVPVAALTAMEQMDIFSQGAQIFHENWEVIMKTHENGGSVVPSTSGLLYSEHGGRRKPRYLKLPHHFPILRNY